VATLVERLQADALDRGIAVSDLLRRVKLTAAKLGLGRVEDWVEQELNGYETKAPEYRMVHGRPIARNPVRGWMPMGGSTEWLSQTRNGEAVASLEELLKSAKAGDTLHIAYPDFICAELDRQNGFHGWNYALEIPQSELARILDRVRTLVLDWALALEKAGIIGSDISFNETEKQKAQAAATTINVGSIGNFAGNLGQGNISGNSSIQINTEQVLAVIRQLKSHLDELVSAGAQDSLAVRLSAIEEMLKQATPNEGLLRGLLTDLRNTLTGAAGNLLASGAIGALNIILGTGMPAS
jgi:hypothetical protein